MNRSVVKCGVSKKVARPSRPGSDVGYAKCYLGKAGSKFIDPFRQITKLAMAMENRQYLDFH